MTVPTSLLPLEGNWQGTNKLWLDPTKPARESAGTAVLRLIAQGKFAILQYTWADAGQPQDGVLIFGAEQDQVSASWVDSWHMQHKMMHCAGQVKTDGTVWVRGSYAAPPGPDWGWKIAIQPLPSDQFRLIMHNISPDGEEMLAVEVIYSRQDLSSESATM